MKKLVFTLLSLVCINMAYGAETAQLHVHLSGNVNNHQYLCVSNAGCVSVAAGVHGFAFPLTPGKIQHIFLANSTNFRMYPQAIPDSCQVKVNGNQSFNVRGTVVNTGNNNVSISNLSCSVS